MSLNITEIITAEAKENDTDHIDMVEIEQVIEKETEVDEIMATEHS